MTIVYNVFHNLAKLIAWCFFSLRVVHPERMIEEGPLILAVNHSSYFDPPLVGICSQRAVYYLARKNLLEWPFFGPLFPAMNVIPVERDGNDMSALREVIKKIREGNGVVLFQKEHAREMAISNPAAQVLVWSSQRHSLPYCRCGSSGPMTPFPRVHAVSASRKSLWSSVSPSTLRTTRPCRARVQLISGSAIA